MPFTTQYTYPVTSSADIGYSFGPIKTTGTFTEAGVTNVAKITIPSTGVWLVEGQINANTTNTGNFYRWGLTTTYVDGVSTIDNWRVNYVQTTGANSKAGDHMTSVFVVTSINDPPWVTGNNTIYMNVEYAGGSSGDSSNFYLTYTRLA